MKNTNVKKKFIILGLVLILTGTGIGLTGLGMEGFQLEHFKETGKHKWYRTYNIEKGSSWVGLKGNNNIYFFMIGSEN